MFVLFVKIIQTLILFMKGHQCHKINCATDKDMVMLFETDKKVIGKIIKEYRKQHNLTQAQLAEKVDLNEKQISRIEAGINYPTYTTFIKLLDKLNIDIKLFEKDKKEKISPLENELINLIKGSKNSELKLYIEIISAVKNNLNTK